MCGRWWGTGTDPHLLPKDPHHPGPLLPPPPPPPHREKREGGVGRAARLMATRLSRAVFQGAPPPIPHHPGPLLPPHSRPTGRRGRTAGSLQPGSPLPVGGRAVGEGTGVRDWAGEASKPSWRRSPATSPPSCAPPSTSPPSVPIRRRSAK